MYISAALIALDCIKGITIKVNVLLGKICIFVSANYANLGDKCHPFPGFLIELFISELIFVCSFSPQVIKNKNNFNLLHWSDAAQMTNKDFPG